MPPLSQLQSWDLLDPLSALLPPTPSDHPRDLEHYVTLVLQGGPPKAPGRP